MLGVLAEEKQTWQRVGTRAVGPGELTTRQLVRVVMFVMTMGTLYDQAENCANGWASNRQRRTTAVSIMREVLAEAEIC